MEKIKVNGLTRLVGFFASPAKHSISPSMHNFAFKAQKINAVYLAFDVPEDKLADSIQSIRTLNMLGANISMPNKIAAIDYMDELSEAAKLIGAINTVVNQNGRLIGHNTDGIGFCESLREQNVPIKGSSMTLLGAGGAATAMICQAALDGMKQIKIFSRPSPRFDRLQQKITTISQQTGCQITLSELSEKAQLAEAIAQSELLVNATSVGMERAESPLPDASVLRPDLTVYDAIYNPRETELLKSAKLIGAPTINGLGMLLYQGAAAFKLWTGKTMPVKELQLFLELNQ